MRFFLLLGLGALACGGETGKTLLSDPVSEGGDGAAAPAGLGSKVAGSGSQGSHDSAGAAAGGEAAGGAPVASSGGAAATAGHPGAGGGQSGSGGSPGSAGTGQSGGGTAGAPAGGGGAAGSAHGGSGGAQPAPDDTGCIARPWTGNVSDLSEKLPILDCSSCSNNAQLGYEVPDFCGVAAVCAASIDYTAFPGDSLLLLPPGSEQGPNCHEQACGSGPSGATNLAGYVAELYINVPSGHGIKIETDDQRRVLRLDNPLVQCSEASSCEAVNGEVRHIIVVKPGAPRGWARIKVDKNEACQ